MALFEGAERKMNRTHDERMELAWTIEKLARAKAVPPLQSLLSRKRRQRHVNDPHEEAARLKAWAASFSRS
jgi:hypothetical protein